MRGFAFVICEFALIGRRGQIHDQRTVSGYSKITSLNSESQREMAYENAVQHARSKYLYNLHKPSDEDVDFAVVEYGFKTEYHKNKQRRFSDSEKRITSKKRGQINIKVLEKADKKRNDEHIVVKKKDEGLYMKNGKTLTERQKIMKRTTLSQGYIIPKRSVKKKFDKDEYAEYIRLKKKYG